MLSGIKGLLGNYNPDNYLSRLGWGIVANNGLSLEPKNAWDVIGGGMAYANQMGQQDQQNELLQAQLDAYNQEREMHQQKLDAQKQFAQYLGIENQPSAVVGPDGQPTAPPTPNMDALLYGMDPDRYVAGLIDSRFNPPGQNFEAEIARVNLLLKELELAGEVDEMQISKRAFDTKIIDNLANTEDALRHLLTIENDPWYEPGALGSGLRKTVGDVGVAIDRLRDGGDSGVVEGEEKQRAREVLEKLTRRVQGDTVGMIRERSDLGQLQTQKFNMLADTTIDEKISPGAFKDLALDVIDVNLSALPYSGYTPEQQQQVREYYNWLEGEILAGRNPWAQQADALSEEEQLLDYIENGP